MQVLPNTQFAQVTVNSNFTGTSVATDTGKVQRLNYDGHYFTFNVNYPNLTVFQAKQVSGFLASKLGSLRAFEMTIPLVSHSSGTAGLTYNLYKGIYGSDANFNNFYHQVVSVDLALNKVFYRVYLNQGVPAPGDGYVAPSGGDINDGDWLIGGDYVSFDNHNKAYQVVEYENPTFVEQISVAPGQFSGTADVFEGSVTLSPYITLTDLDQWVGAQMRVVNVPFRVFLADPTVSYAADVGDQTSMSLNLREET